MREDIDPVQWAGQQAVVALPEMTATTSCDHVGADALMGAFQRAAIGGTELRLVVTAQHVSRVLSLSGPDRLLSIYPSLEAATGASKPAALAVVARPGGS